MIAITDRDDESPELPGFYFNSLVELKGFRNKHLFGFFAVAGAPETGCAGADGRIAAPANRLGAIVDMTDTGRLLSICADWHAEDLGEFFYYGWPQSFVLTGHPTDLNGNGAITDTDGEIEVALNGRVVSSRSADGRTIWFYEEWGERESIYFSPMAVPKPGTTIDVRYLPECP